MAWYAGELLHDGAVSRNALHRTTTQNNLQSLHPVPLSKWYPRPYPSLPKVHVLCLKLYRSTRSYFVGQSHSLGCPICPGRCFWGQHTETLYSHQLYTHQLPPLSCDGLEVIKISDNRHVVTSSKNRIIVVTYSTSHSSFNNFEWRNNDRRSEAQGNDGRDLNGERLRYVMTY